MPTHFHQWLDVADRKKAELLLPTRGQGINYFIKLEKDDSDREREVL